MAINYPFYCNRSVYVKFAYNVSVSHGQDKNQHKEKSDLIEHKEKKMCPR